MSSQEHFSFPLVDSSYDNEEILRCIEVLLSGRLTMGKAVRDFEQAFAKYIGAPDAVMTNSGSSANLLSTSAIINPVRSGHLHVGDYVAVPAVCWSTSLWPLVQLGLKPVLVDADPSTLNLSVDSLNDAILRFPIKAVMMVHVLGNTTNMHRLLETIDSNNLYLIEDTCESLGSTYKGQYLGTLGDFGTYSFYFSHHMTTIEGGMVVARQQSDYDLLRCLRSHGWSREQSNHTSIEKKYSNIDPRFLFINVGFNIRPTEIQGAFGLEQLGRLNYMNKCRRENTKRVREAFRKHTLWHDQLLFPSTEPSIDPCWFGFPFLTNTHLHIDRRAFQALLERAGVDTRPIVSGNMDLQPAVQLFDIERSLGPFVGAQQINDRGFFIGIHSKPLNEDRINWLAEIVLTALDKVAL